MIFKKININKTYNIFLLGIMAFSLILFLIGFYYIKLSNNEEHYQSLPLLIKFDEYNQIEFYLFRPTTYMIEGVWGIFISAILLGIRRLDFVKNKDQLTLLGILYIPQRRLVQELLYTPIQWTSLWVKYGSTEYGSFQLTAMVTMFLGILFLQVIIIIGQVGKSR